MLRLLSAPVFALLAGMAAAAAGPGTGFVHKDWELACDNTRTCRAAGYQREGDAQAVSVLLTRAAGANQPITGQVALGSYDARTALPAAVTLTIAGRPLSVVPLAKDEAVGELQPVQVQALVQALLGTGEIAFVAGQERWLLSDAGAAAVLLRMDEVQGRVGTRGAIVRRGPAGEQDVRPALPRPVVRAAAVPRDAQPPESLALAVLRSLPKSQDCADLSELSQPARIWRLDAGKVLVSARCWLAAYNAGYGFWVANDRPPYRARAVTHDGTEFDPEGSRITSVHKGRGLGDCYSLEEWVWDGSRFVRTAQSTTGQCRMVAAGGPWSLATWVSEVVPPADKRTTGEQRK